MADRTDLQAVFRNAKGSPDLPWAAIPFEDLRLVEVWRVGERPVQTVPSTGLFDLRLAVDLEEFLYP